MHRPIDTPTEVRRGEELNVERLTAFLHQHFPDWQGDVRVAQFPSGFSNLTYLVQIGDKELVLRRPPFGANIKSAHDMQREYDILQWLLPVYPKVPKPLIYTNDDSVIGAEFYLMERVKGLILRNRPPEGIELTVEKMRTISQAVICNLAELHAIDIYATNLIRLGKPEGYVQRQVAGWIGRYEKAATDVVPTMNQAAEWLQSNLPTENAPALIHNDYKYDNVVLNPDDLSEIMAVLDWEMATVGDPLMDLGTTLAYWADADSPQLLKAFSLTAFPGNMNREEVAQCYAQASGRSIDNILFYYVFGCYKVGVIVQQIYARYKKGFTQDPRFANLIYLVHACGECATKAIQYGRISHWR
ncbi:MAG: phosphotransferase family protein [Cytophagales bacterium]|nr:phosphotransferase family protein [Bernardetiaceae bacterium]MDW8205369.1 phosphotransferase family protein [Cytophagales bacterium]